MFIAAAQAVADQGPPALLKQGLAYPIEPNILEVEIQTELFCDKQTLYNNATLLNEGVNHPC
jgi:hypothetical protein